MTIHFGASSLIPSKMGTLMIPVFHFVFFWLAHLNLLKQPVPRNEEHQARLQAINQLDTWKKGSDSWFFCSVCFSPPASGPCVPKSMWLETLPRLYRLKNGGKKRSFIFDVKKRWDALHPKRFFVNGLPRTSNQPTGGPIFVGSNDVG